MIHQRFDLRSRPVRIEINPGFRVDISQSTAWGPLTVEHVERHYGVAREHIDAFFQLPATIERSDTRFTFLVTMSDTCVLDVLLRNLPKNYVERGYRK